jgi:hypothetical protein
MKEKVLSYLKGHKGDLSMLAITFILSLAGGLIALASGIEEKGLIALCSGILADICVNSLGNIIGMRLSEGNTGLFGAVLGTLVITLI